LLQPPQTKVTSSPVAASALVLVPCIALAPAWELVTPSLLPGSFGRAHRADGDGLEPIRRCHISWFHSRSPLSFGIKPHHNRPRSQKYYPVRAKPNNRHYNKRPSSQTTPRHRAQGRMSRHQSTLLVVVITQFVTASLCRETFSSTAPVWAQ